MTVRQVQALHIFKTNCETHHLQYQESSAKQAAGLFDAQAYGVPVLFKVLMRLRKIGLVYEADHEFVRVQSGHLLPRR